jgi:hypothetical protein
MMRALDRHGYSTRTEDLYGPYAAKRLPSRANLRGEVAACLTSAAGYRHAAARFHERSRPAALEKARVLVLCARDTLGGAGRLP